MTETTTFSRAGTEVTAESSVSSSIGLFPAYINSSGDIRQKKRNIYVMFTEFG